MSLGALGRRKEMRLMFSPSARTLTMLSNDIQFSSLVFPSSSDGV